MKDAQVSPKSKFKFVSTEFDNLFIVKYEKFGDKRGFLTKYFQESEGFFKNFTVDDIYSTHSNENVVRGMHHQTSGFGQCKYVTCLAGEFWDIAVDLREESRTFKKTFTYKLDPESLVSLIIPPGFSHGTYSTKNNTVMLSVCSGEYLPEKESGLLMSSLNLPFYSDRDAVVSVKDLNLKELKDY